MNEFLATTCYFLAVFVQMSQKLTVIANFMLPT